MSVPRWPRAAVFVGRWPLGALAGCVPALDGGGGYGPTAGESSGAAGETGERRVAIEGD
jgi:hypothetical protein